MILDRWFSFYVSGMGKKAHLLNRIKLFYWRQLRRKNVIGFFCGMPIVASDNLTSENKI